MPSFPASCCGSAIDGEMAGTDGGAVPFLPHVHNRTATMIRIGTAGWSVPTRYRANFPASGSQLEKYATQLTAAEINSSFYRPHRRTTYERWAASVPDNFRFAVKIPKAITHERRLRDAGELLNRFLSEVAGLGPKLGPLLVQLPPSLAYVDGVSDAFF